MKELSRAVFQRHIEYTKSNLKFRHRMTIIKNIFLTTPLKRVLFFYI